MHIAVLLHEAVEALAVKEGGVYVDGTFGRGGHSRELLSKLDAAGRLIALDRDPQAIDAGRSITDPRFTLIHAPFSELGEVLDGLGVGSVDGVLLDLGVSSPQFDDAGRGMSFRFDAPLDMRMDTSRGQTVAQWLAGASVAQITEVLRDYGEERFAYAIAKAIADARAGGAVETTGQLAEIVEKTVRTREPGQHPATRSFQALRIFINQELEELSRVLPVCADRLGGGGRLAVISFHSLEDRIVKRFMRDESSPPRLPPRLPVRAADLPPPRLSLVGRAQRPCAAEVAANPRARSAVLRVAERRGVRARQAGGIQFSALLLALLVVLGVASALGIVSAQYETGQLYNDIEREEAYAKNLEEEWGRLQLEQSTLSSHRRVESVARERLGMFSPGAGQIFVMEDGRL